MPRRIDYTAGLGKTSHAIAVVLREIGPVTDREADWIFYRADRDHLNRFGRPVLGLRFRDRDGLPVSREVALLVEAGGGHGPSWRYADGTFVQAHSPWIDADLFSRSDISHLGDIARDLLADRAPDRLRAAMHPGWNAPDGREWLCASNMLADRLKTEERLEELAYMASVIRF